MPKPIDKSVRYQPGLDGLRALAVGAVFAYHLNPAWLPGGLLGVAVFFTLSGWLITKGMVRTWERDGRIALIKFWVARFRRLIPAMLMVVVATTLAVWIVDPTNATKVSWQALSAVFYVNNWHNIFAGDSYFDQFGPASPLAHMWSLSVEEQFYIVWPLVLTAVIAVSGKNSPRRTRSLMFITAVVLTVASFAAMWLLATPGWDNTRAYEGTDTRAGGMLAGAALVIAISASPQLFTWLSRRPYISDVLGAVGLIVVVAMMVGVDQHSMTLYHGGIAVLTAATCALIVAVQVQRSFVQAAFSIFPFRWIGERSYGIYLWHFPVIALTSDTWAQANPVLSVAVQVTVTLLLAAVSWHLVEDPIRREGLAALSNRIATQRVQDTAQQNQWAQPQDRVAPATVSAGVVVMVMATTMSLTSLSFVPTAPKSTESSMAVSASGVDSGVPEGSGGEPGGADAAADSDLPVGPPRTLCTQVIHVGDSTSIGMFDDTQLPSAEDNAALAYKNVGALTVTESVFGARSTTEGWQDYPSAVDSVQQLLAQGQPEDTCWVIATGVNDAANVAVGAALDVPTRIRTMMDLLKDQRVMWVTTTSDINSGPWAVDNMRSFNTDLIATQKSYPQMKIYDWANEVDPSWYIAGDAVHFNATGNAERSRRFAAALATAFPQDEKAATDNPVVSSGL